MKYFLILFLFSNLVFSQNCPKDPTGFKVVEDLTICFTKIEYNVEYHPECNCYYYNYKIISPENNKGKLDAIFTNFPTSKSYHPFDETLPYDPECDKLWKYPPKPYEKESAILISIVSCPQLWGTISHYFIFPEYHLGGKPINPGESANLTIASKFPPGKRKIRIEPDDNELVWSVIAQEEEARGDEWFEDEPGLDGLPYAFAKNFFFYELDAPGPSDPEELELFNGGGQKSDDVNLFLRYLEPKDTQTTLPAGQNTFELYIYYGKTTKPETFKASLNDQDIKSLFKPKAGGGDFVKLNLKNGRNVLVFEIDGVNERGHTATDRDRLVIIVQ